MECTCAFVSVFAGALAPVFVLAGRSAWAGTLRCRAHRTRREYGAAW